MPVKPIQIVLHSIVETAAILPSILLRQTYILRNVILQCQQLCDAAQAKNDFRPRRSGRDERDGI